MTPQEQMKLYAKCEESSGGKQPDVVFSRQSHGRGVAGGPARSSMSMYNFLRRGLKERLNSTATHAISYETKQRLPRFARNDIHRGRQTVRKYGIKMFAGIP
jgi:hypothetical protein